MNLKMDYILVLHNFSTYSREKKSIYLYNTLHISTIIMKATKIQMPHIKKDHLIM